MTGTPEQTGAPALLKRPVPPRADYSDEVTEAQYERIKSLVKEDEVKDAEVVSGPAW